MAVSFDPLVVGFVAGGIAHIVGQFWAFEGVEIQILNAVIDQVIA